ncbi:hypothetical protein [Paracoccus gahaiensis]|uniref:hypothetical protein n=1 Tax=Paracoccus gahaiensis TaxID=1706839 RepID=UPI00145CF0C3|nr:hypothetical protein [Paracoccus gahaiensis]
MAEDIRWNTDHSSAVGGVLLTGLVYALRRLDQTKQPEGWHQDLFEQISAHLDDTPKIPTRGDPERVQAIEKFGSSEAMREAHQVLEKVFALALGQAR